MPRKKGAPPKGTAADKAASAANPPSVWVLSIGSVYAIDKQSSIRGKIDSLGFISALYTKQLRPEVRTANPGTLLASFAQSLCLCGSPAESKMSPRSIGDKV